MRKRTKFDERMEIGFITIIGVIFSPLLLVVGCIGGVAWLVGYTVMKIAAYFGEEL